MNIYQDLLDKKTCLSVIGLGYVGLPIALAFAKKIKVIGFDIKSDRVALMNQHIDPSNELDASAFEGCDITFTSHPEEYGDMLKATDYIDKNYPPCYVFSSGGDFLLENLEPMVALLESKGVTCESRIYGDKSTGHVFHVDIKTELAKKANDDQTEFMKKLILGS